MVSCEMYGALDLGQARRDSMIDEDAAELAID